MSLRCFQRRVAILTQIDADDDTRASGVFTRRTQSALNLGGTLTRKTERIHQRPLRGYSPEARCLIARLGLRRHRTDFDVSESKQTKRWDRFSVLVQTSRETQRTIEVQAKQALTKASV